MIRSRHIILPICTLQATSRAEALNQNSAAARFPWLAEITAFLIRPKKHRQGRNSSGCVRMIQPVHGTYRIPRRGPAKTGNFVVRSQSFVEFCSLISGRTRNFGLVERDPASQQDGTIEDPGERFGALWIGRGKGRRPTEAVQR